MRPSTRESLLGLASSDTYTVATKKVCGEGKKRVKPKKETNYNNSKVFTKAKNGY